jgi:DNA-binding transcriptional ArsR family regulator
MIDRIRQDIQDRLDQLVSEADRLRQALAALGGDGDSNDGGSTQRSSRSETPTRSRARSSSGSRSRGGASASRSRSSNGGSGSRAAAGGTKNAVLRALADANGEAMTATEVASATGLGRASVSTTLSKLARAGDVTKASRGYQLAQGSGASAGESQNESAAVEA